MSAADHRDRVAVVTGAGSGIGAAIARERSGRGHRVIVTDVDPGAAAGVADHLTDASSAPLDVTDPAAATAVAERAVDDFGRLDVWVSNAGISHMARFVDVSEDDLDRTLAINLKGVFVCGQAAARAMRRAGGGGAIVNTASMAGKQ